MVPRSIDATESAAGTDAAADAATAGGAVWRTGVSVMLGLVGDGAGRGKAVCRLFSLGGREVDMGFKIPLGALRALSIYMSNFWGGGGGWGV